MVEVEIVVFVVDDPLPGPVLGAEETVDDHLELSGVEAVAFDDAGVVRRTGAVVGGEYHDHLFGRDLRVEVVQELRQLLVEPVVHVFHLDRFGAVALGDAARGIQADVQQIGCGVLAQPHLREQLLGESQRDCVARGRVEHPFDAGGDVRCRLFGLDRRQTVAFAAQVFGFVEVDDRALRVAVALAGVFQFPREGNVSQNLAAEVVFSGPHGQRFGIERRGDPVGARGVHPEYVTRVPACHDGRCGVERHGGDEALGRALLEAFAQRRGHQIAGRTVADAGVAVDAHRGAVLDEFHDVVVHVIDPPLGDDAVYRRVGSRGERGERNGGRGMQVVVMALGIEGAAAYEPQESLVGEVVGVAVQVFGAHRTDDDLYDQPRRFGRRRAECRGQGEKGEEIAEFHHSIY